MVRPCKLKVGKLYVDELHNYLHSNNMIKAGVISEDSTRLQKRVEYDRKTNQLIGLVAPLDPRTGLPFEDFFDANSAFKIMNFMENYEKADQLTVLMLKPYFQGNIV